MTITSHTAEAIQYVIGKDPRPVQRNPAQDCPLPAGRSVEREALFQVQVHCEGTWPFSKGGGDQYGHPLRDLPGTGDHQVELFKQHDLDGDIPGGVIPEQYHFS